MPLLEAHAQPWKAKHASTNTSATTAAATTVMTHTGLTLSVDIMQPLELKHGWQTNHFVLQKDAGEEVSVDKEFRS